MRLATWWKAGAVLACMALAPLAQAQRVAMVGGTLVEGQRIVAVGTVKTLPVPADATVISTEGMTVMPGDIIIGDEDGVLAFPPEEAEALIAKAQAQKTKEEATIQAILEDRWDLSFVDALEARCNN